MGESGCSWFVIIQVGGGGLYPTFTWATRAPEGAFGNWQQKWPATRASTITQRQEMDQVRGNRHKQQRTIDGNSNTVGGWKQYHLRAAVDDWRQKWPAMRETTTAMDNGGCWCLTVVMDSKMKIAFDGVGDGQRQGGGQTMVQCWR